MRDIRKEEITQKMGAARDILGELYDLFSHERISYEVIAGDIEGLQMIKDRLLFENRTIEEQNKQSIETASSIIETANEEAGKILSDANGIAVNALDKLDKVEKFCLGLDKTIMERHRKDLMEVKIGDSKSTQDKSKSVNRPAYSK